MSLYATKALSLETTDFFGGESIGNLRPLKRHPAAWAERT